MLLMNQILGFGINASPYVANAVDFDGVNDSMLRGGGLGSVADHAQGIFSVWLRVDGHDGSILRIFENSTNTVTVTKTGSNKFSIDLFNPTVTSELNFETTSTYTASSTWLHILASWDMGFSAGNKISHLYVNDSSNKSVVTDSGAAALVDYTASDWAISRLVASATNLWDGCMAEFYFAPGQFLDFSDSNNRRKFISASGKPVSLGATGSLPTGTAPQIYLKNDASTFGTNSGLGGNFTITGTLDVASTSPSN